MAAASKHHINLRKINGFTIGELLIVVVVIGILAAIVTVAYTGITGQARDSKRSADLKSVQNALELYYIDKGGYPRCGSTGPNTPPVLNSGTLSSCLADDLVPQYMSVLPVDPTNDGAQYAYRYAAGYKKTGATYIASPVSDNYILATKQDTVTSPTFSGWGQTGLTLLLGSDR